MLLLQQFLYHHRSIVTLLMLLVHVTIMIHKHLQVFNHYSRIAKILSIVSHTMVIEKNILSN